MIINWGDAPIKAFITVTYLRGTCTVSLGDKSFSHTGGGTYTFTVNKKGKWTVTAKDSLSDAKSTSTVEITYNGQVANISLDYTINLFNNGSVNTSLTGGWTDSGYIYYGSSYYKTAPTISSTINLSATGGPSRTSIAGTANKINLTKIKTVHVNVTARTGLGGALSLNTGKNCHSNYSVAAATLDNVNSYSIDVSGINGEVYIALYVATSSSAHNKGITVNRVWMESRVGG